MARTIRSPLDPERQIFPPIAQKRNFTPRRNIQLSAQPVAAGNANTNRANSFLRVLQLPQLQRLGEEEEEQEEQDSSVLTDGTDYERLPPHDKRSRWDRKASPSKLCLRSPSSPQRPGASSRSRAPASLRCGRGSRRRDPATWRQRAVAVAGRCCSSPVARRMHCRRGRMALTTLVLLRSLILRMGGLHAQRKQPAQSHHAQACRRTDSATTTATPHRPPTSTTDTPHPQPQQLASTVLSPSPPLSQTTWTKDHWLRLEFLAHLRRRDPVAFDLLLPPELDLAFFERHPLRRKEVAAQGARLLLEPWHLEVVEAFRRSKLGLNGSGGDGWDDATLAKRLFALLDAEKRRARKREMDAGVWVLKRRGVEGSGSRSGIVRCPWFGSFDLTPVAEDD
ncbi:hypothetical protein DL770_005261 [Monosporascus sp. CRB-9-2]|nr:hypothetical protein DL770_005261 [Monosporascus sp. CRB-9-2]